MSTRSAPAFSPWRALTHPLWWAALTLLAVNDHLLKGAEFLPASLTGKLSDFAGLLVAPALLAVILGLWPRARSRAAWLLAHGLVGLVFAAIQLSPAAAAGWSAFMGFFGTPWAIWSDPADLMALPMLAVSALVLGARCGAQTTVSTGDSSSRALLGARVLSHGTYRRPLAFAGLGLGMLFCMATSPLPPPHKMVPGKPDLIQTDVYLYNSAGGAAVTIWMPSEHLDIDCDRAMQNPRTVLRRDMFDREGVWNQQPGEAATLWPLQARSDEDNDRGCYAVLFEIDNSQRMMAVWRGQDFPVQQIPRFPDEESLDSGAITIDRDKGAIDLCVKGPMTVVSLED